MKQPRQKRPQNGFTVIELLVVLVILIILGSLVAMTYSGVRAKNRNGDRQTAVNTLQGQLEAFYAQTNKYPTLANLNDANWRKNNLKNLGSDVLQDPRWSKSNKDCTVDGQAVAANKPAAKCYSYQVTSPDGSACDNAAVDCAHYTLTATLEGGDKYVKSSLN